LHLKTTTKKTTTKKTKTKTADVESQPQWNRGVKASRVVERSGNRKAVHQTVQWGFLALRGDMHLILEQTEDRGRLTIDTRLSSGTMMRNFRSRVGVRDKAPGVCELEMEMFVAPSIYVPFGIRHMVGGQVRRQLRGVLSSLRERFEERVTDSGSDSGSSGKRGARLQQQQKQQHGAGGGGAFGSGAFGGGGGGQQWLDQLQAQAPWWTHVDIVAAA
jgi:hypothetical protein